MANKDLFAQAIADAKKLKEISMANAKQAIEEAFAPRIQEMFRMKLSEIDDTVEEDLEGDVDDMSNGIMEDDYNEMEEGLRKGMYDDFKEWKASFPEGTEFKEKNNYMMAFDESGKELGKWNPAMMQGTHADDFMYDSLEEDLNEMTLEEILAELELEEGEETKHPLEEAKDDEDEEEETEETEEKTEDDDDAEEAEEEVTGDETVAEVDLDTLVSRVADAVMNALNAKEGGVEDMEADAVTTPDGEMEDKDAVISLDEILAELTDADNMEEGLGDFAKKVGGAVKSAGHKLSAAAYGTTPEIIAKCKEEKAKGGNYNACLEKHGVAFSGHGSSAKTSAMGGEWNEGVEEGLGDTIKKVGHKLSAAAYGTTPEIIAKCKEEKAKGGNYNACLEKHGVGFTGHGSSAKTSAMGGQWNETVELNEAIETINTLKAELNEINLLNAKLLYVNKIFKSKSLSEAQKVKVISAFDRATTITETKNIYATLNDSLTSTTATKKAPLKESLGFASKPIGSAPARPIVEADAYVHRMQQLAGLRQPNI